MLFDIQNVFSSSQAITATADSTNILDLGAVRNIGVGEELYLVLLVTVAFTDAGSDSTVTPSLQTDTTAAFGSPVTVRTFDVLAALTAINTKRMYKLEPFTEAGIFKRFIKLVYTVANGNLTTGSITAFLTKDIQAWNAYTVGFVVQ